MVVADQSWSVYILSQHSKRNGIRGTAVANAFDPEFIESVVEHMNLDHADAVSNYATAFAPEITSRSMGDIRQTRMVDASASGITLEQTYDSGDRRQFFIAFAAAGLPQELEGPEQMRSALVTMAKKARILVET